VNFSDLTEGEFMKDLSRGITSEQADGRILLVLAKELYQKEAVFQAAYKFTHICHILIEPVDAANVGIYFRLKSELKKNLENVALDFCNEVLDQQVRLDLERSYGPLRELIVKKAFSPISITKDDISS